MRPAKTRNVEKRSTWTKMTNLHIGATTVMKIPRMTPDLLMKTGVTAQLKYSREEKPWRSTGGD